MGRNIIVQMATAQAIAEAFLDCCNAPKASCSRPGIIRKTPGATSRSQRREGPFEDLNDCWPNELFDAELA